MSDFVVESVNQVGLCWNTLMDNLRNILEVVPKYVSLESPQLQEVVLPIKY